MKINYPRPLTHYRHTYWTMKSVSAQNVSLSRTRRLPHLQGQPGSPIQIQLLPPQPLLWKVTVNCYQATRTSLSNCEKGRNDWYDSTVKMLNSIFTSKKCQDFRFLSQDVKSLEVLSPTFTTTRKMNRLQLFFFLDPSKCWGHRTNFHPETWRASIYRENKLVSETETSEASNW